MSGMQGCGVRKEEEEGLRGRGEAEVVKRVHGGGKREEEPVGQIGEGGVLAPSLGNGARESKQWVCRGMPERFGGRHCGCVGARGRLHAHGRSREPFFVVFGILLTGEIWQDVVLFSHGVLWRGVCAQKRSK